MRFMTIEELESIRTKIYSLESLKETINSLSIDCDLHSKRFDYEYSKSNKDNSYIEKNIIKHEKAAERLTKKYNESIIELAEMKEAAINIIMLIKSEKQQKVLIERYINCKTWNEITEENNYAENSSLLHLHRRALLAFLECQK